MSDYHLRPDEIERLGILIEEMGESLQVVGKILRHGYESTNPLDIGSDTNRQDLQKELGDVKNAVNMLTNAGDVIQSAINQRAKKKAINIKPWLHYQQQLMVGK